MGNQTNKMSDYMKESDESIAIRLRASPTDGSTPNFEISSDYFSDTGYSTMYDMQQNKFLCDYTIISGGETFNVHKIVLASCSDFFKVMFNSEMKEKNENVYESDMFDCETMESIVKYVYTYKISVHMDNIRILLQAATYFQMRTLIEVLRKYIRSNVSFRNCAELLNLSKLYNLDKLPNDIIKYMTRENLRISQSQYNQVTYDEITTILNGEESVKCHNSRTELELVDVVIEWIEANEGVDLKSLLKSEKLIDFRSRPWVIFSELMKIIRWGLIPPEDLIMKLGEGVENVLMQIPDCNRLLMKAKNYHMIPATQHLLQDKQTRMRWNKPSLAEFNGAMIKFYDFQTGTEYQHLCSSSLPHHVKNCAIVELNDFILVVGGKIDAAITDKCYRYDPRFNKWLEFASLSTARSEFALVAHGDHLYAIGGYDGNPESLVLKTCEIYDPKTNKWDSIESVQSLSRHKACTVNDTIYITGGTMYNPSDSALMSLYTYNISTQQWLQKANMTVARCDHAMANLGNVVYVVGGMDEIGCMDMIEKYSIEADQWTVCQSRFEVDGVDYFVNDDKLYFCDGKLKVFNGELDEIEHKHDTNRHLIRSCYHTLLFKDND